MSVKRLVPERPLVVPEYVKYQSATTPEGIFGFFGGYRWLSNFHLVDIHIDGITYSSTEAAYMSRKTLDEEERYILSSLPPNKAKAYGQTVKLRPDWEEVKVEEMLLVNILKYENPDLRDQLINTGDLYLEETNHWNDTFWGVCNGVGKNNLGKVLMNIRRYL